MSKKSKSNIKEKAEKPSSSEYDLLEQPKYDYSSFTFNNGSYKHNINDIGLQTFTGQNPTTNHINNAGSYSHYSFSDKLESKCQIARSNHGQCGLHNLGNTCFMNAILQCLNHVPPLVEHYLHFKSKFSPFGSHYISEAFANLLQSMRQSDAVRPEVLKRTLCKYYAPQFRGANQQDSHDFLTVLLDALHQESKIEEVDDEERSIITDIFRGQMEYTIKCSAALQCKNVTINTDSFLDLPLFIEEIASPLPTPFKFRFVSLDGHQKIHHFSFLSMDTIQSIINRFQQAFSISSHTKIVAMNISADNTFSYQYKLSTILNDIDDQSTIFYEIDDDAENPLTVCYFCDKSSSTRSPLYHYPPLLLKLSKQNVKNSLHTCLSNHFGLVDLIYEFDDRPITSISLTGLDVYYEKPIIISFSDKTIRQLKSTFERRFHTPAGYIRTDSSITLQQCLINNISIVERMSPNKTWFCPECQEDRQLTNENRILSLPKVLIIHLKRFDIESQPPRTKIETFVKYPLVLDMTSFLPTASPDGQMYDLIGVCLHSGTLMGGHYIAYAKNLGNWFSFNDSIVNPISASDIVSANAYILFYLKRSC